MDNNQNGGYSNPQQGTQYGQNQGYNGPQQGTFYGQNRGYNGPQQGTFYGQNRGYNGPQQGMPYGQNPVNGQPPYGAPQKKKKTGLIVGIIIGVVVLLAAGFCAVLAPMIIGYMEKNDSKKVLEVYFESIEDGDLNAIFDEFHPDIRKKAKEISYENLGVSSSKEFKEYYDYVLGEGYHVTYEIQKEGRVKGDELEELLDDVEDAFGSRVNPDKVYVYEVKETYKGSNGSLVQKETFAIAKDDGKWSLIAISIPEIISNKLSAVE